MCYMEPDCTAESLNGTLYYYLELCKKTFSKLKAMFLGRHVLVTIISFWPRAVDTFFWTLDGQGGLSIYLPKIEC
jgi:hypothetical protein